MCFLGKENKVSVHRRRTAGDISKRLFFLGQTLPPNCIQSDSLPSWSVKDACVPITSSLALQAASDVRIPVTGSRPWLSSGPQTGDSCGKDLSSLPRRLTTLPASRS